MLFIVAITNLLDKFRYVRPCFYAIKDKEILMFICLERKIIFFYVCINKFLFWKIIEKQDLNKSH